MWPEQAGKACYEPREGRSSGTLFGLLAWPPRQGIGVLGGAWKAASICLPRGRGHIELQSRGGLINPGRRNKAITSRAAAFTIAPRIALFTFNARVKPSIRGGLG